MKVTITPIKTNPDKDGIYTLWYKDGDKEGYHSCEFEILPLIGGGQWKTPKKGAIGWSEGLELEETHFGQVQILKANLDVRKEPPSKYDLADLLLEEVQSKITHTSLDHNETEIPQIESIVDTPIHHTTPLYGGGRITKTIYDLAEIFFWDKKGFKGVLHLPKKWLVYWRRK